MIGFAIPWIAGVAFAAAVGATLLHFLSVRQPRVLWLPTTRFVPERDARAVARQARPNDLLLLALRLLALLSAGAALAGVRCGTSRTRVIQLMAADVSLRTDSVAVTSRFTVVPDALPSVLWVRGLHDDPGAAITAAIRAAAARAQENEALSQIALSVLMPPTVRSRDGWDAWRREWPASIRVVLDTSVASLSDDVRSATTNRKVRVLGRPAGGVDDVVSAAFASRGWLAPQDDETADIVNWPVDGSPEGWERLSAPDTVGAVAASGMALVSRWERTAIAPPLSDTLKAIAWWSDGEPAAVERSRGGSCVRDVAIPLSQASDLLLSPSAHGLLNALRAPCGGVRVPAPRPVAANTTAMLASADRFRDSAARSTRTRPEWLGMALLLLSCVALLAEWLLRRRQSGELS